MTRKVDKDGRLKVILAADALCDLLAGHFGEREAELAENQRLGRDVGVIDASDLTKLIP